MKTILKEQYLNRRVQYSWCLHLLFVLTVTAQHPEAFQSTCSCVFLWVIPLGLVYIYDTRVVLWWCSIKSQILWDFFTIMTRFFVRLWGGMSSMKWSVFRTLLTGLGVSFLGLITWSMQASVSQSVGITWRLNWYS